MYQETHPSIYDPRCQTRILKEGSRPIAQPLPPEEIFSYFCKYDELTGSMICPDVPLLSIGESCYQTIGQIFDDESEKQSGHVKRFGVRK